MTTAAALDALTKAQANNPFSKPGVEDALSRRWRQAGHVDQSTMLAARMAKLVDRPLISPDARAQFVKASGMPALAAQLRANSGLTHLSEQVGAQIAASVKASGIADQVAARWKGQLQEIIDRSGISDQLTARMREGLTNVYTPSPAWSWDVPASTVETLRPIGQEALGSVIEVVADELEDGPADAADWSPVELVQNSAGKAAIGWAFVLAVCEPYGPPDLSPGFQSQVTTIVAAWAFFGIVLPGMMRLAGYAFGD